ARAALAAGAAELGVATINEALGLRAEGVTAPMLAWLHPPGIDFGPALLADYPSMLTALRQAVAEDAIRLRGLMSHMVYADQPNNPINDLQAQRFTDIVALAREQKVPFEVAH